jgi:hypothetical protein
MRKIECQLCGKEYTRGGKLNLCGECATKEMVREARQVWNNRNWAEHCNLPATLTLQQWLTTLDHFAWKCAYCQERSYEVLEHFIPMLLRDIDIQFYREIGGTTARNCVPACHQCNSRKGRNSPIHIWNGFKQGMFPSVEMIARINRYLQVDLEVS